MNVAVKGRRPDSPDPCAKVASAELSTLDATAQAALVRSGEVSPIELVEAAIERISLVNPKLNAVIHPLFDEARAAAGIARPGPAFAGVPLLVKDAVLQTHGAPCCLGNRLLKMRDLRANGDSVLAERYRRAGFLICGYTNTPEFAICGTTEPIAFGPTLNPWNTKFSTGGSSGGAAAAVASGMVPVAHGNDMTGSIRIPAGWCGLFGLKPTYGRTTLAPAFGEYWWQLTHEHVLTRSVRDSAAILDAVAGPAPGDPYVAPAPRRPYVNELDADPGPLRIGVHTRMLGVGEEACPEGKEAVKRTAGILEELGHFVEEACPASLFEDDALDAIGAVVAVHVAYELERVGKLVGKSLSADDVEPYTWFLAEKGRAIPAYLQFEHVERLHRFARGLSAWWESGYDMLLTPTSGNSTPTIGYLGPDQPPERCFERHKPMTGFTAPWSISGQPAASVPIHETREGLPVGVQLVAGYGREDMLFRISAQLERACPWADGLPAVHASGRHDQAKDALFGHDQQSKGRKHDDG